MDDKRANFKDLVSRLSEQLTSYRMYLIQKVAIVLFNDLINSLSDQLSQLSALSFHILHLLIKDVNQPYLIVEQFLSPYPSDVKVRSLKEKHLGQWLEKTLQAAGVTNSTFESNNKITVAAIKRHLENELPSDENCHLSKELLDPLSEKWGHWDFVLKQNMGPVALDELELSERQECEIKGLRYLSQIREIHRSVLFVYFIRQNMVRAATVASIFGEVWIYGDSVGKVVLEELLASITNVIEDNLHLFKDFWGVYFNDFEDYATKKREFNFSNPCFEWLKDNVDLKYMPTLQNLINSIKEQISLIRMHSDTLPQIRKQARQIKKELFQDTLDYMKLKGKHGSPNYIIIKNELDKLKLEESVEVISNSELSTVITFPPTIVRPLSIDNKEQPNLKKSQGRFSIPKSIIGKKKSSAANDIILTQNYDKTPLWGNHIQIPGRMHWIVGDGNCFFSAVAFELNRQSNSHFTHQIIRERGIQYLERHMEFLDNHTPEDKTSKEYINEMKLIGTWANGPIIEAVANEFTIHLCILDVRENLENGMEVFPIHINDDGKEEFIVGLVRQSLYYNALELEESNLKVKQKTRQILAIENVKERGEIVPKKQVSESSIRVKRSDLSIFEKVSLILGGHIVQDRMLASKMNGSLLAKPDRFHNDMHKYIYENFLLKHNRIIRNYPWMLTIHYLIRESTVNILIKLYRKVNACFCIIYGERDIYTNLSKLERTMMDERLYRSITNAFESNKFFQFTLPAPEAALEVQRVGDNFEVVIDHYKIPEIKDEILAAADKKILIRNEDRQRIIKLEQELVVSEQKSAVSEQELADRKQELADRKQELADREQELADREQELADREQELADREQELADREQELADREQELADREQELADREIELEDQDQVITRLKSIIKDKNHEISELRSQSREYKVSQYNKSSLIDNQFELTRNSSHHSTMFSRSGKAGSSSSNDYEQISDNSM